LHVYFPAPSPSDQLLDSPAPFTGDRAVYTFFPGRFPFPPQLSPSRGVHHFFLISRLIRAVTPPVSTFLPFSPPLSLSFGVLLSNPLPARTFELLVYHVPLHVAMWTFRFNASLLWPLFPFCRLGSNFLVGSSVTFFFLSPAINSHQLSAPLSRSLRLYSACDSFSVHNLPLSRSTPFCACGACWPVEPVLFFFF